MTLKTSPFSAKDVTIEADDTLYNGFFQLRKVRLKHRLFDGGWSQPIERELFAKALAASTIVYDPKRDLVGLVEQFRIGVLDSRFGPWTLEGVAGMVEPGEDIEQVIVRELAEEANIEALELLPVTGFYPTPGSCNEYTHLFCALCDLSDAGGHFGLADEGEDIRFGVYPADEVFGAMLDSRANNAATLIGLLWLQVNRSQLRATFSALTDAGGQPPSPGERPVF